MHRPDAAVDAAREVVRQTRSCNTGALRLAAWPEAGRNPVGKLVGGGTMSVSSDVADPRRPPRWRASHDVVAVAWLLVAGVGVLLPALSHGTHLGPYDILGHLGLSKQPGTVVHNFAAGDQIDAMIPWSTLAWTQVHHGQLPLWNPYNALGLPLAFNWQSAPFAPPAIVGYLVPVQFAYDVGMMVTLAIAGTGAYIFARILGLGVIASALSGTLFELSGPLTAWLGYPHAAVMSWTGWLFAATTLVLRRKRPALNIAFLALVTALAVYSGQPEVAAIIAVALALYVLVVLVQSSIGSGGRDRVARPLIGLVIAGVSGAALAGPLLLPGFQVTSQSVRNAAGQGNSLPTHDLMYLITQGFDGIPVTGSTVFGSSLFYNETAAFVGIIAVVFALVALRFRWRRPEVLGLSAIMVVMASIVFVSPVSHLWSSLPLLGTAQGIRALMALAFSIAILAGIGLDAFVRMHHLRPVRRWTGACFGGGALVVALVFVAGRNNLIPYLLAIRNTSFIGPAVGIAAGLMTVGVVTYLNQHGDLGRDRRRHLWVGRGAGGTMLFFATAFLISAGAPIFSSSSTFFAPTPAEVALQRVVGSARVGFGAGGCGQVGIDPAVNDVYGVRELDAYDPTIPRRYFSAWTAATGGVAGIPLFNDYCPRITTASDARLYGVGFVLVPLGSPGPQGSVLVSRIGDENLFRIPDSAPATLTAIPPSGRWPSERTLGRVVPVTSPDPTTWVMETVSDSTALLRLRLTNDPGWHATIDGRPLPLETFAGVMWQARLPAGHHQIELRYWPKAFSVGIALACISLVGLTIAVVIEQARRRRPLQADGRVGEDSVSESEAG
jgi:hypothetical protein